MKYQALYITFWSITFCFLLGIKSISAQVMLEFTWTLENVNYEGLLYVPTDTVATMTVRVLDTSGHCQALILERVDIVSNTDGSVVLSCSKPEILAGAIEKPHRTEIFRAHDREAGTVSNGYAETRYEINIIDHDNINEIIPKYLKNMF